MKTMSAIEQFVDTHLNSFMKWELVRFFYTNQHVADTAPQIASYVKRRVNVVRYELSELVESGLLHKVDFDDIVIFTLTEDPEIRRELEQFMQACTDRKTYLKVLYAIMHRLR